MIRQLLSLFIISISFISIVSVQAAGGVIVTRGQAQNINWSVNGASGCNAGYQGTSYPGPANTTDTVANDWEQGGAAGVYSNTGNATLTFHGRTGTAFPQTYVFKCTAVGSPAFFDTATVTINDCPNGTPWNGTACAATPPSGTISDTLQSFQGSPSGFGLLRRNIQECPRYKRNCQHV